MRRISLLAATILGSSLAVAVAHAQMAGHEDRLPGPVSSEAYHADPLNPKFEPPSPSSPQAPGVNAANLPDDPEIDISEVPQMVPQVSTNPAPADWPAYGRTDDQNRYSPLSQITPANVGKLKRAFVYHTGSKPAPGQANKWAAETTPIKVGDSLYTCSALNDIMRIDAATGKEIWRHNSGVKFDSIPYTAACKGVTYFTSSVVPEGQPCHNRIIASTLDMRLMALDAETGKMCEGFGFGGQINLMQGIGESVPGFVSMTTPPPVINGIVVVNHEVLDGQRRWAPSGVIRGYDAETGKFVWAWDVNNPDDHHQPAPGKHYSRGTPNSWAAMTGDNELGLVYVPTGNSAADYYSAMRSDKENAVSSSLVALDVRTGAPRWVFQTVHKDVWDYDIGSQVTKFDYPNADGTKTPALILPTKRGQTFILDRATGKPLPEFPVEERPAPSPGVIPDDSRSPTQPWSVAFPRLGFPDLKESDMWGMSPIDQLFCRIKYRKAAYVGEFTPPHLKKPWIEYPGYNGGSDWGSMAYDPKSGIVIANWNNTPMYDQLVNRAKANKLGLMSVDDPNFTPSSGGAEGNGAMSETPYGIVVTPFWNQYTGMMCNKPPYGMIEAIDIKTKKVLWQKPLGTARANGPWGLPTGLPLNIGTPNNGGSVVTAGGLIFVAAATDNQIRAIDMKTGEVVWSDVLPGGGQANPMTYEVNGKQYVAIMAGGHHFMMTPVSDALVVYALPDDVH
ncbi:pyrroloquinoline quinone-dependent dehydrogenase [Brytella acorum]|uniref:Pyrroloquinoline quinone-dependent dehydrogenase n=1 Tax=Brytella acorum TaxID=2959299 RepID=A0AA35UGK7_9PROT|nr:pyrroloquinoline quinone-dependent dehydrogenase [Brytella acorum]MDF3624015.1 pyrroloquinoline quinone-dependent dehydrogenase [Brytella acorum]CAI9120882.1 pyrroloquinoline quinone-dependent dehydrogenase [Brytella acorum]